MGTLFQKLFDIRQGEGSKAIMMFLYIFLIIASLLIVKPVRNSLFLTHFGISKLPYAFILVAVFAAVITTIYSRFAKKIRLNLLILYTTVISIASLLFCWVMLYFHYQAGWFYYFFYIWVALFAAVSTSQFWLLANYVFNAREAKRLFGFVGAGAISGGIFGGYLTNFLAPVVGTDYMLFFCIAFLLICMLILKQVWKTSARHNYKDRIIQEKRISKESSSDNILKLFLNSKHLTYLAAIIGIGVILANLVDYQYNAIACEIITDEDDLTAFFGFWLSNLSIASLVIQLFFTGRILKTFGVIASLFFLPIGVFLGASALLFNPGLWSAIIIKVSEGGFKQSINKAGLELLALPIPSHIKNQTKTFIDVFVDSLATGIGGLFLIIFMSQFDLSVQNLSYIIIGFLVFWLYFIIKVKKEYINSFRVALEKRSIDLNFQNLNIEDASVFKNIKQVLEGNNERQIHYALQLIENSKNETLIPYLENLIDNSSPEIKIQVIKIISQFQQLDYSTQISKLINDDNFDVKVESICYLTRHTNDGPNKLVEFLDSPDYKIRSAALICLAMEYRSNIAFRKQTDMIEFFDRFISELSQTQFSNEQIHFMKLILAQMIGTADEPALYPFLKNLLADKCHDILEAAISNAGATRDKRFIPQLINFLNNPLLRKKAREALSEYGEDVVEILSRKLASSSENKRMQVETPKVLAMIGSQKSVNVLIDNLEQTDLHVRYQILKALNKLKVKFPFLKFDKHIIQERIFREMKYYFQLLQSLYKQNQNDSQGDNDSTSEPHNEKIYKSRKLLIKALEEKLDRNLERIFRLLGLRYPPKDMYNTYLGITSNKTDLRANAVEFLDNILNVQLKRLIIPIVEDNYSESLVAKTTPFFGTSDLEIKDQLLFLLNCDDNWLKACTLFYITESRIADYQKIISKLSEEGDSLVKETSAYYHQQMASA